MGIDWGEKTHIYMLGIDIFRNYSQKKLGFLRDDF